MNLPVLQFRIAERQSLPPDKAQATLDWLWQRPEVRKCERFRVWGIRIPILLLLCTFVFYQLTRNRLPAELVVQIQSWVLIASLITILTVLITYKLMMTRTLRRLVREYVQGTG